MTKQDNNKKPNQPLSGSKKVKNKNHSKQKNHSKHDM
ncbi:small acid-soluble spore protein P [Paraliobacillus salinarum]|nr:small acid-soluble spore protein P [Paraliobacillus salinarum]